MSAGRVGRGGGEPVGNRLAGGRGTAAARSHGAEAGRGGGAARGDLRRSEGKGGANGRNGRGLLKWAGPTGGVGGAWRGVAPAVRCRGAELPVVPAEHKLLSAGPTEPWSIREKLCLASSVMRSGDQNW